VEDISLALRLSLHFPKLLCGRGTSPILHLNSLLLRCVMVPGSSNTGMIVGPFPDFRIWPMSPFSLSLSLSLSLSVQGFWTQGLALPLESLCQPPFPFSWSLSNSCLSESWISTDRSPERDYLMVQHIFYFELIISGWECQDLQQRSDLSKVPEEH
jgi:hypothetical protein